MQNVLIFYLNVVQTLTHWYDECILFMQVYVIVWVKQDSAGLPILCAACQDGLQRIVERILDGGADPNAKEKV